MSRFKKKCFSAFLCVAIFLPSHLSYSEEKSSVVIAESYYRVKWGYFDEFIDLFKRNHYPILKEMKRLGYIEEIVIDYPVHHAGEQDRWDVRVTTVIRKTKKYQEEMRRVTNELYPDKKNLKSEESKRFRLLLAHQDVRIRREDLSKW